MNSYGWTEHERHGLNFRKRFFPDSFHVMRVVFLRHGALLPRSILFHVCSGCIVFGLSDLAVAVFSPEDHGRFALLLSGMWVGVSILTAVFLDPFSQRGRCGRTHGRMLQAIFGWFGLAAFLLGILMVGFSDTQWFALPVSGFRFLSFPRSGDCFFAPPPYAGWYLHRSKGVDLGGGCVHWPPVFLFCRVILRRITWSWFCQ